MPPYYVKPKKAWKASRDPKDIEEKYGPSAANVNRYIRAFMRTDATHMLMVDADMEIPPHALDELLRLDVDIASGVSVGHASAQMSTVNKWFPKPRPKAHRSKPYRRFLRPAQIFGKPISSKVISLDGIRRNTNDTLPLCRKIETRNRLASPKAKQKSVPPRSCTCC